MIHLAIKNDFFLLISHSVTTSTVRSLSSVAPATTSKNTATTIIKNVQVPGLKNGMDYVKLGHSDLVVSKVCSKFYYLPLGIFCLSRRIGFDVTYKYVFIFCD